MSAVLGCGLWMVTKTGHMRGLYHLSSRFALHFLIHVCSRYIHLQPACIRSSVRECGHTAHQHAILPAGGTQPTDSVAGGSHVQNPQQVTELPSSRENTCGDLHELKLTGLCVVDTVGTNECRNLVAIHLQSSLVSLHNLN
jgi:hypothetical protein